MTNTPPTLLTASDLARAWGVSRQNIHALKRKGIIRPLESGLYDEAEARRAYLRNSDPAYRRAPKLAPAAVNHGAVSLDRAAVRSVKAAYQAKLAQLKYEQKAGILIDGEKVKTAWFNTLRIMRDRILQIPDRMTAILMAETDPLKFKALLTAEITRIIDDAENSETYNNNA